MIKSNKRLPLLLSLTILSCLLASCGGSVDTAVDFYTDERWEATMVLSISPQMLSLVGGAGAVEQQLDQLIAEAKAEDIRVTWEKSQVEGQIVYTIELKGQGLDSLSTAVFDDRANIFVDESSGRRLIYFSYSPDSTLGLDNYSLTLRGGEIIDGNGVIVDDHTITWENASRRMEATLTERPRLELTGILSVGGALIIVAGMVYAGIWLWRRNRPVPAAPCPWCSFWIPAGARFCPGCGRQR